MRHQKYYCDVHKVEMVPAGITSRKTQRYICSICTQFKEIGWGIISRSFNGYGFISQGNSDERGIFFHFSQLPPGYKPRLGDQVRYLIGFVQGKGPVATRIEVIKQTLHQQPQPRKKVQVVYQKPLY